jgi:hypothetical protein
MQIIYVVGISPIDASHKNNKIVSRSLFLRIKLINVVPYKNKCSPI